MSDKALIIVDVQNCFCSGGELAVEGGDEIVPIMNEYIERFRERGFPIYATRDWHPEVTKHFETYGGKWPPHCIQGTAGAEFHPDLKLPTDVEVISAGVLPDDEGYSGFEGTNEEGESFESSLRSRGILHLYVGGLATDYCVKETVLDARRRGFAATLLVDAIRGVNIEPEDSDEAIEKMRDAGAAVETIEAVKNEISRVHA